MEEHLPGDKYKMLRNPEQTPYSLLKSKIEAITSLHTRALACLAYASGSRVSELNQIRKQDLLKENIEGTDYLKISVKVLKKKKVRVNSDDGVYFDEQLANRKDPIKRIYEKHKEKFVVDIHKRYNLVPAPAFYRSALVRIDEAWLVNPILEFAEAHTKLEEPLFALDRSTIYRYLTSTLSINPHGFRKLRATHLVQEHHYTAHQLKKFFGWSTSAPSDYYVNLSVNDLAYGGAGK